MIDYIIIDRRIVYSKLKLYPHIDVDSDHVPIEVRLNSWFTSPHAQRNISQKSTSSVNGRWNTSILKGPVETGD